MHLRMAHPEDRRPGMPGLPPVVGIQSHVFLSCICLLTRTKVCGALEGALKPRRREGGGLALEEGSCPSAWNPPSSAAAEIRGGVERRPQANENGLQLRTGPCRQSVSGSICPELPLPLGCLHVGLPAHVWVSDAQPNVWHMLFAQIPIRYLLT